MRSGNAASLPDEFGAPLVHREGAAHDARAGIRNADQLERTLDRAILAIAAVQHNEDPVEPVFDERFEPPLLRIESVCIDVFFLQTGQYHGAALDLNCKL